MARMKCPNCGFTNERTETRCLRCGSGLIEHSEIEATPVSVSTSASVPDWRKEVTRKAREFGERKKVLTTPPRPLKDQPDEAPVEPPPLPRKVKFQELDKDEPLFIEPPPLPPVPPPPPPAIPSAVVARNEEISTFTPPAPIQEPAIPVIIQERRTQPRLELDLTAIVPQVEESEQEVPLHFGRRAASFVVDHGIIGVVILVIAFLCHEIFSYDLQTFSRSAVPFIGGIFLFHFLYYFYFWKTSRQTPGQVFFSLEVKVPLSGSIGAGKVVARWASLVFLNVFNVVPLFYGKKFLLMDHLSGTVVRSMKPED